MTVVDLKITAEESNNDGSTTIMKSESVMFNFSSNTGPAIKKWIKRRKINIEIAGRAQFWVVSYKN